MMCMAAGIELLLQSLEQLEHTYKDKSKAEDLDFLRSMLKAPEFHSLLDVCNKIPVANSFALSSVIASFPNSSV